MGRWARKPVHHTSWEAVVTPTDRPKSVRNPCIIEFFVALFVLSLCPFDISVGVGAFVIGLSQISSFFFNAISVKTRNFLKLKKIKLFTVGYLELFMVGWTAEARGWYSTWP